MGEKARCLEEEALVVPQSLGEAKEFLLKIGEKQRAIVSIQTALQKRIDRANARTLAKTEPLQKEKDQLVEGLLAFAASHRNELTKKGKIKTVKLSTGDFGWRLTPLAVMFSQSVKVILENLKAGGLHRFIRVIVKEEANKEALLEEPKVAKTIKGITIFRRERFFIKPRDGEEIARDLREFKL